MMESPSSGTGGQLMLDVRETEKQNIVTKMEI